jgi:pyrroline-5-carboxylate reductase
MPNTPSMVQEGITVWTATPQTPPLLVDKVRTLLSSFGEQIEVADESYLDMATAISGISIDSFIR